MRGKNIPAEREISPGQSNQANQEEGEIHGN